MTACVKKRSWGFYRYFCESPDGRDCEFFQPDIKDGKCVSFFIHRGDPARTMCASSLAHAEADAIDKMDEI